MTRSAALFPIVLALGAIILAPVADAREEGSTEIEKCQTINKPGSYKLVNNLVATDGDCLVITASFVTIDLGGFNIIHIGPAQGGAGIVAAPPSGGFLAGIAVRNGSIDTGLFGEAVELGSASGSIVEALRVSGPNITQGAAIIANGIVKGNTVVSFRGTGISATGTVTGNDVSGTLTGMEIGAGSTVIGNTVSDNRSGIVVSCPANLTDNTAVNNPAGNLMLNGEGCHSEDNVAP